MSISEEQELLLSQLVDHELPIDEANEFLAGVLDELGDVIYKSEACGQLKRMLQLQQAMAPWRRQTPPKQAIVMPAAPLAPAPRAARRFLSLAAAALLGGVLVAGGFYLGGRIRGGQPAASLAGAASASAHVVVVTPEQRREIARAFALHESVAGPLSWYAADEATIQLAPAQDGEKSQPPIAVVLRLVPAEPSRQGETKTYVIVCRSNDPAVIELPRSAAVRSAHLRLLSTVADGAVNLHYALAADGKGPGSSESAAVVGRRQVGLSQTPLGQLALNDCLMNVDASAWVIRQEGKN